MLRNILLSLSGLAVGSTAFLAVDGVKRAVRRHEPMQAFYALAFGGVAGIVFLIAKIVYRSPGIPISGDSVWYAVSLGAASIGCVGILFDQRRRNRRQTDP